MFVESFLLGAGLFMLIPPIPSEAEPIPPHVVFSLAVPGTLFVLAGAAALLRGDRHVAIALRTLVLIGFTLAMFVRYSA
jgi:hypothetical protein